MNLVGGCMRSYLYCLALFMALSACTAAKADCVILLHGLARSADSMSTLANVLNEQGYNTVNLGYPSRDFPIETLVQKAIPPALDACAGDQPIHFVTHSLGGILLRQYLSEQEMPELGRAVMLGPPNQGSEVVDKLRDMPGFYWLNGDAGNQLGTDKNSIPLSLGPAESEVGVIAGDWSINWILSLIIPGPDDGKVSVERTKLKGMADHIVLPVTHPLMMKNDEVIQQVLHFLRHGMFDHSAAESE